MEIDASLLDTTIDNTTFTTPLPANLADQILETMAATPASATNSFQATVTQALPLEIASALRLNESLSSGNSTSTPISSTGNTTLIYNPAPLLYCPCNCTYTSAACCLSQTGIVWEDPSKQIVMAPMPNNATVCCDSNNGRWVLKSTTGCPPSTKSSSNGSDIRDDGFQSLGTVRWNASVVPYEITNWQREGEP